MKAPSRKLIILTTLGFVVLCIGGFWLLTQFVELDALINLAQTAQSELSDYLLKVPPYLYFAAFVILPAFGVPLSIFYLTALSVLGRTSPILGIALGLAAVAGNIILCRLLSHGFLEPILRKILKNRHLKVPEISRTSEWQIVLATRLSPLPFVFQNYMLALSKSHWRYYLGLSWIIQSLIGAGVMILGKSIFNGGVTYALFGIFLIVLISLLIKWLRKKIKVDNETILDATPAQRTDH